MPRRNTRSLRVIEADDSVSPLPPGLGPVGPLLAGRRAVDRADREALRGRRALALPPHRRHRPLRHRPPSHLHRPARRHLATALAEATLPALGGCALIALGLWLKARLEEEFLRQELGAEAYDSYRRRVPMLLPFG